MASTGKDKHYWTQLRSALTAGHWSTQYPAKTPTGAPLSWKELFRKFNKHCRGFEDVCEVASKTRLLGLLLAANSKDEDQDDLLTPGQELQIGGECILPEERVDEGREAYEELKKLEASNFDTLNFALAYYSYALGRPEECISHLSRVPDVSHVESHIPSVPASLRSNTLSLQVPSIADASLSSGSGSFVSTSTISIDEIKDGRAWAMTETIRSICLQGMSYEKLSESSSLVALKAYGGALSLLSLFESEIASVVSTGPPTTTSAGKLDFKSFSRFRELWRWIERLIWRAVALCATTSDLRCMDLSRVDSIWVWLKHYMACSIYWPPSFRTQHRCVVLSLHLRALVILYSTPNALPVTGSNVSSSVSLDGIKSPQWLQIARSVVQEYRSVLSVCTKFPRAGERNVKVEDFVDLCVAVWEASGAIGEHSGWVIDVLWWATRLTFNSPRIFRHMTRLFYVSGDLSLAKRTLKLYIQVVGKAYQTLMSDGGNPGAEPHERRQAGLDLQADIDTDRNWVETLCQGTRMLCRSAASSKDGGAMDDLKEAGEVIEKAKLRLNKLEKDLVALVELAEGVWRGVLALKANDPFCRPKNFSLCHDHLLQSLAASPSSSAAYHLALSFARPGPTQDIEQAILYAGQAMEADPGEVRYWHLMGLLLSSAEKWQAAMEILDRGADIGEARQDEGEEEATEADVETVTPNGTTSRLAGGGEMVRDGNRSTDSDRHWRSSLAHHPSYAPSRRSNQSNPDTSSTSDTPPLPLLPNNVHSVPPANTLLSSIPDHPRPSMQEQFELALQLRMTQVAMTEYVEGAEIADVKWLEVFAWIAEKRGIVAQQPRASLDGGRPPQTGLLASSPLILHSQENGNLNSNNLSTTSLSAPIPIHIQPATPDAHYHQFNIDRTSSDTETGNTIGAEDPEKTHGDHHHLRHNPRFSKRSHSTERDSSKKSKRVQQFVKSGVHKGQVTITTISKKIGNGVVRNGPLRRSNSTPDFHAALRPSSYQASSIHSRKRISSIIHSHDSHSVIESPPPPPPPPLPTFEQTKKLNNRTKKENRLLSDLWLMSAATFRRLGKIEQAKGAIQEAEVRDEDNPNVWVQLGLYYTALGHHRHAIDAFHKALFIDPDDISASVHLCRLYLSSPDLSPTKIQASESEIHPDNIDLAAGILSDLTKGSGWDVSEAWYYLAKAYGMQGRKDRKRECLETALRLSEHRPVRDIGSALGWCI